MWLTNFFVYILIFSYRNRYSGGRWSDGKVLNFENTSSGWDRWREKWKAMNSCEFFSLRLLSFFNHFGDFLFSLFLLLLSLYFWMNRSFPFSNPIGMIISGKNGFHFRRHILDSVYIRWWWSLKQIKCLLIQPMKFFHSANDSKYFNLCLLLCRR